MYIMLVSLVATEIGYFEIDYFIKLEQGHLFLSHQMQLNLIIKRSELNFKEKNHL